EVIYNGTNASPFLLLNEVNIGDIDSPTIVDFSGLVPVSAEWALVTISTNTPSAQVQVYWLANGRSRFLYDAYNNTFQNTWNGKVELEGVIGRIYGSAADEDVYLYANGYIDNMLTDVSF